LIYLALGRSLLLQSNTPLYTLICCIPSAPYESSSSMFFYPLFRWVTSPDEMGRGKKKKKKRETIVNPYMLESRPPPFNPNNCSAQCTLLIGDGRVVNHLSRNRKSVRGHRSVIILLYFMPSQTDRLSGYR